MQVIYQDNHLFVVEKPVNIPVQEDSSQDPDLLTLSKEFIKEQDNKPGNVFLGLVHRLDRPVGGVIAFAKTSKAASRLSDQIRRRAMGRTYLVVVQGQAPQSAGQLRDFMYKDRHKNQSYIVNPEHTEAKEAILNYQVIASKNQLQLLAVQLETGRSHQIRVQLSHHGMPIQGDQKYNSKQAKTGQQIALWAYELELEHPTLKELMTFYSFPPTAEWPWSIFQHEISSLPD